MFLFSACRTETKQEIETIDTIELIDESGLPAPNFVTDSNEKKIIAITDTLYKGDTLKIKFRTPHPRDFAITTPEGKFFFIIYGGNDTTKPSLVDWLEFEKIEYLEIITDQTTANPWDATEPENKIIFTKTGEYEILLSENLETDNGTPVEIERVYYNHKKK